jgi:hypothetical protein
MLFLRLYHGRYDPEAELDGPGIEGPTIGPLRSVHGVYNHHIALEFPRLDEFSLSAKFGIDPNFPVIPYDGPEGAADMLAHAMPGEPIIYYGDYVVFQDT